MKARGLPVFVLALGLLALGACVRPTPRSAPVSGLTATSAQAPTPCPTATLLPTDVQTLPEIKAEGTVHTEGNDIPLPDSCLVDSKASALFVNPVDGYCVRYPARFRVGDVYPPGIANLYGPPHDQTLEPVMAASTLRVMEPVPGVALADMVDWWLQHQSVQSVTRRTDGLLGGEPAEIVDGRGERSGLRAILALYEGRLYALTFYPVDERFPQAAPDVEELWQTVIDTFAFLLLGPAD